MVGPNDQSEKLSTQKISPETPVTISVKDLVLGCLGLVALFFGAFLFFDTRYALKSTNEGAASKQELMILENKFTNFERDVDSFRNSTDIKVNFIAGELAKIGDVGTLNKRIDSACSTPKLIDEDIKRLLDEMRRFMKDTIYQEVVLKDGVNIASDDHKITHILNEISAFEKKVSALRDYCTFSDGDRQ